LTGKTDGAAAHFHYAECLQLESQSGVVAFSIRYIDQQICGYEMRDADWTVLTAQVARVMLRVCKTVTASCSTTSNRRRVLKSPDFRRIRFGLTLVIPRYILVGMLAARKNPKRGATKLRDPERTRERLLQAAFREIYKSGFQSASLDTILVSAGVTKGALYYYFKSKQALGYAVVEEVIAPDNYAQWVRPLQSGKDPIDALIGAVRGIPVRPADVRGGCQLINLAQEMSPLDAGFRKRLATIFDVWREAVAAVLRKGQAEESVRRDVNPADAAGLLIAMVEGYGSLAKNAQDPEVMKAGIRNIVDWLRSLRSPGNRKRVRSHRC
jgi:TetR/AcrR family transcriptional repressor of nem operon